MWRYPVSSYISICCLYWCPCTWIIHKVLSKYLRVLKAASSSLGFEPHTTYSQTVSRFFLVALSNGSFPWLLRLGPSWSWWSELLTFETSWPFTHKSVNLCLTYIQSPLQVPPTQDYLLNGPLCPGIYPSCHWPWGTLLLFLPFVEYIQSRICELDSFSEPERCKSQQQKL